MGNEIIDKIFRFPLDNPFVNRLFNQDAMKLLEWFTIGLLVIGIIYIKYVFGFINFLKGIKEIFCEEDK